MLEDFEFSTAWEKLEEDLQGVKKRFINGLVKARGYSLCQMLCHMKEWQELTELTELRSYLHSIDSSLLSLTKTFLQRFTVACCALSFAPFRLGAGVYALTATYGGLDGKRFEMLAVVFRDDSPVEENANWDPAEVKDQNDQSLFISRLSQYVPKVGPQSELREQLSSGQLSRKTTEGRSHPRSLGTCEELRSILRAWCLWEAQHSTSKKKKPVLQSISCIFLQSVYWRRTTMNYTQKTSWDASVLGLKKLLSLNSGQASWPQPLVPWPSCPGWRLCPRHATISWAGCKPGYPRCCLPRKRLGTTNQHWPLRVGCKGALFLIDWNGFHYRSASWEWTSGLFCWRFPDELCDWISPGWVYGKALATSCNLPAESKSVSMPVRKARYDMRNSKVQFTSSL